MWYSIAPSPSNRPRFRASLLTEVRVHEYPGVGIERHFRWLLVGRDLEALLFLRHLDLCNLCNPRVDAHFQRQPVSIARLGLRQFDLDLPGRGPSFLRRLAETSRSSTALRWKSR